MRRIARQSRSKGRRTSCERAVLLFAVWLASTPVFAADQAAQPAAAAQQEQFYRQLTSRDRRLERAMAQAASALDAGRTVEGLTMLQQLLDRNEDAFLWIEGESRLSSLRGEASRQLDERGRATVEAYDNLFGGEAQVLLDDALAADDMSAVEGVARRHFHTAAGLQAADRLATWRFDRGQFDEAARLWWRLVQTPAHAERLDAGLLTRAALAHQAGDDHQRARDLLARLERLSPRAARRVLDVSDESLRAADDDRRGAWRTVLGRAGGVPSVVATPPYPEPVWSNPHVDTRDPAGAATGRLIQEWVAAQQAELAPTAVARHLVVFDGIAAVRDLAGVMTVDLSSGRVLGRYRSESSLIEAMRRRWAVREAQPRVGAAVVAPRGFSDPSFAHLFAENSLEGTLSTDGRRIYVVELLEFAAEGRVPLGGRGRPPAAVPRAVNRLAALPVVDPSDGPPDELKPVWTAGASAEPADGPIVEQIYLRPPRRPADAALAGHFFLGPPLPLDGRLYVLSEVDGEVRLLALAPETGRLLWAQPIAAAELPIDLDPGRQVAGCSPVAAGGVLICPTGVGLLVAVDPLERRLLWAHSALSDVQKSTVLRGRALETRAYNLRMAHGHRGFVNAPHVHQRYVLTLASENGALVCLDLESGRPVWSLPRGDAEYIGAVTDDVVLLVGRQACRGVATANGEVAWSSPTGMPAGRGVHLGRQYLLPLEDGRGAARPLATGKEVGFSRVAYATHRRAGDAAGADDLLTTAAAQRPGNLYAAGDLIVSVGPYGLAAFRQSGALRDSLLARLRQADPSPADRLLAGELHLMEGDFDAAEVQLAAVLDRADADEPSRRRATGFIRELLYLRLAEGTNIESILSRLEQLAQSPIERGRLLVRKAEFRLSGGDFDGTLESVSQLSSLDAAGALIAHPDNPAHQLAPLAWAQDLVNRACQMRPDDSVPRVQALLAAERDAALDAGSIDALRRYVRAWPMWPAAAAVRTRLAEQLAGRGQLQEAELLLLENRRSDDERLAGDATRRLAILCDRQNLPADSAAMADELQTRCADVRLSDGQTGREAGAALNLGPATREALAQRSETAAAGGRVRISEERWWRNDPRLNEVYRTHEPVHVTPPESPVHLLRRNAGRVGETGKLLVVNETAGVVQRELSLPLRTAYPFVSRSAFVGHFFPLGDQGAVTGVSLLEGQDGEPLWTLAPPELSGRRDVLRVGPAGPTFCVVYTRQFLAVVDPASGAIRWQRSDVAAPGQSAADVLESLAGDEHVLALLSPAPGGTAYAVYDTHTGRELRTGTLDVDTRQRQHVCGRRLVSISSGVDGRRLRVWDPLSDRVEYESDPADRLVTAPVDERELAFVLPSKRVPAARGRPFSRLVILDVETARVQLDIELGEEPLLHLNYVRAFRDRDRYYVNFQRATAIPRDTRHSYFATDTYLPAEHMQGDVWAIDAASGRVLWRRSVPQRSFLQFPHLRLPVLVSIARARDRWNSNQQSLLVEVFDARTGDTLALEDNILADRLRQYTLHRAEGRLELIGLSTAIDIEFGAAVAPIPHDEEPL